MMMSLGWRLAAMGLLGAAAGVAEAQIALPARDDTSFTVPFPGKRFFSGNGSLMHLTMIGPKGGARILGTRFDINLYSDGETPAADLRVEIEAMVDGEVRPFVLRGSDLGFGANPGMHRGSLFTGDLDGLVWQPDGFPHSIIEVSIEAADGGPIEGTTFFVGSTMTFTIIPSDATATTETFADLQNEAGWTYGTGNEYLELSGGNPGEFIYDPFIASAVPAASTGAGIDSDFTGDYAAGNVIGVGIDLKAFNISGGTINEKISLVLYHDNGTPHDFADDWGAYTVGHKSVPLVIGGPGSVGWYSYDFIVPSQSRKLPEGWRRFGDRGAGTWGDLMRDVSGVQFYYGDPSKIHIFREWSLGIDNPRIYRR